MDATTSTAEPWVPAWDGAAYAANTGHHRAHDDWFLRAFPVQPADRVLDLGCGSGDFTAQVAALVPDGHVVGMDAQASMLAEAEAGADSARQSFVLGAVQDLDRLFPAPEHDATFDAVMSRAVLHWVPRADHPAVFAAAARLLRPGGWLRVECGGAGNVATVVRVLDAISAEFGGPAAPWNFTDAGTALDLIEAAGFDLGPDREVSGYVHTVAQHRAFDRESMLGWLHSQAIEAYAVGIASDRRDAFRAAVAARVDELARPDGTFDQTYVRLDLLAYRPER